MTGRGRCNIGLTPVPADRRAQVHAWVQFLSQWDWQWFATLTFKDATHAEAADKRFRRLVHEMNCALYPDRVRTSPGGFSFGDLFPRFPQVVDRLHADNLLPRSDRGGEACALLSKMHGFSRERIRLKRGQGVRWVRSLEWQKRGVLHFHALFAGVEGLRRLSWMDRWHAIAGYGRIEEPRAAEAVVCYASKYVSKGGQVDVGGPLDQHRKTSQVPLDVPARVSCNARG